MRLELDDTVIEMIVAQSVLQDIDCLYSNIQRGDISADDYEDLKALKRVYKFYTLAHEHEILDNYQVTI